jgi:PAS domain S-box-containing protein
MIEDNEFYWTLLNTLKDGVYFADRKRKVTYWNKAAEAITGYRSGEILGINCSDNILVHIDERGNNLCTGECPLAWSMETGKPYEKKIFLHHKDGHRVPVLVRVSPVYGSIKNEIVGAVEIFTDLSGKIPFLEDIREREHESFLSHLTGLPSRQYMEASLNLKLAALKDFEHPFGVYRIKVEGLSNAKSKHGLKAYEEILKTLSNTLIHNVGASEIVGEWSDDEFLGIVSHGNAEKLSRKVNSYRVLLERSHYSSPVFPVSLTFSVHTLVPGIVDTLETIREKCGN